MNPLSIISLTLNSGNILLHFETKKGYRHGMLFEILQFEIFETKST